MVTPEEFEEREQLREGERPTDLVVVERRGVPIDTPGRFLLVPASEWCSDVEFITTWAGPDMPDVWYERRLLREMTCNTVHVDNEGYFVCKESDVFVPYPCPQASEELRKVIRAATTKLLNERANEDAAESQSFAEADNLAKHFDRDVWVKATFGDVIAVNGSIVYQRPVKPPARWVRATDWGERWLEGYTAEFEKEEWLFEAITPVVSDALERNVPQWLVARIIDVEFNPGKDYISWTSNTGKTEVWVSKRALQAYERAEEERMARERAEEEARMREAREREQIAQERERQAQEAERRKSMRNWDPDLWRRPKP